MQNLETLSPVRLLINPNRSTQQVNKERRNLIFSRSRSFSDDADRVCGRGARNEKEVANDNGCDVDHHGKLPEAEERTGGSEHGGRRMPENQEKKVC